MPPRKEYPPANGEEVAELREEVTDLKIHVRVLIDAMDEIREELQYLNINGIRTRDPLPPVPVLKRMAADPCAEDWSERLVIDYGDSPDAHPPEPEQSVSPLAGKPPPEKLFAESGDQRRLF